MVIRLFIVLLLMAFVCSELHAKPQRNRRLPEGVLVQRDLVYATVEDGVQLKLDLYLPKKMTGNELLFVWIHGGGWRNGSKAMFQPQIMNLASLGYAVASIDYRLGGLQNHPNHIHDCNAAIRWLKAKAPVYGYSIKKVGVGGGSAGGHLALLVGVASDVPALQGKVGDHLDQNSRVDAIVDFYGPSDLYALGQATARGRKMNIVEAFGKDASPVSYLDAHDPPVIIFHGDLDPVVVPQQSITLDAMYKKLGVESILHLLKDAKHGGRAFATPQVGQDIKAFLDKHLKADESSQK
ncbi:MAG: alpha/beta hydrolase [Phycisphaeraceae bacterium]|nr:alpha/beta hydrolase [Phycisphaeraceae bacterium]